MEEVKVSPNISLVILCAGNSTRFGMGVKKQWLRIEHEPLWLYVTNQLKSMYDFDKIVLAAHSNELHYMENFIDLESPIKVVAGGETRQESMRNALEEIDSEYVMVTDVARACVQKKQIEDLIASCHIADCIVPYLNVSDTVVYENATINRDEVKLIQTPQLSKTAKLKEALINDSLFTDDSSAIKNIGGTVTYIKGDTQASKLTYASDLEKLSCLKKPSADTFTGFGYDVHAFEENKPMVLGGTFIEVPYGFKAHSDGDVLIHSVIDALLGACGAGDIGEFFPDTDQKYKGADSKELLKYIVTFIQNIGYELVNIDLTIVAQQPKINPYKQQIKQNMATLLNLPKQMINIKATTSEKMGFIGRCEGIAVYSVANLKYYDWSK